MGIIPLAMIITAHGSLMFELYGMCEMVLM